MKTFAVKLDEAESLRIEKTRTELHLCDVVLDDAERTNKGSRTHGINTLLCQFKPLLAEVQKIPIKEVALPIENKRKFIRLASLREQIGSELYLVSKHL